MNRVGWVSTHPYSEPASVVVRGCWRDRCPLPVQRMAGSEARNAPYIPPVTVRISEQRNEENGQKHSRKISLTTFFVLPLIMILEVPVLVSGVALGTYLVFSRNLPAIPDLESYKPRTVSTFYADDGTVIGAFYKEKRFVVELSRFRHKWSERFLLLKIHGSTSTGGWTGWE